MAEDQKHPEELILQGKDRIFDDMLRISQGTSLTTSTTPSTVASLQSVCLWVCLCSPVSISNREHHWCQNQNIQVSQEFQEDITGCDLHRLPLPLCCGCAQPPDNISDLQSLCFYCYRLQIHLPDNMQTFSPRNLLPSTSPRKLQRFSQRTKIKAVDEKWESVWMPWPAFSKAECL